ncbi:DUF2634 domain-containing protein [Tissierella carlieri]|uniref:DUF2634 domain-containing protein n=1 Tax=Tissierella carlieri TaxID=689904 RepID=A0ABT1SC75_9FIRM|nr:DUF2634 domain-containing protein [Tissierella carlieri]MCQ4924078.1 DUF2634 domain-containing protein [Tissierella carlieri]
MAGYNDTDIKLTESWQLTQATNGDAPIIADIECLIQDIKLEALTQEGELFYDSDYGWSLLDFIQSDDDDLIRLEIKERVKSKLERRSEIDIESVQTGIQFEEDSLRLKVSFRLSNGGQDYSIDIELSRVNVEVIEGD